MPMSPDYGTRAAQIAPLQEHRCPDSRSIMDRKGLNLINKKLFHGRPHRCVLAITSSCI